MLGNNALLVNGTETILGEVFGPYWDGPYVGGATGYSGNNPQVVDAAAENLGIFRVWSISGRPGSAEGQSEVFRDFPYTEEALASRDEWDPTDNPITRCEPPGMPSIPLQPLIFQFLKDGENLILHSKYFDIRRTIHMDESLDPADWPASPVGVSIGRWEGSNLVIHTTRINYPYSDSRGTRQSDAAEVIERYALSDDQTRLDLEVSIVDSFTFTRPATQRRHFLALGQPFAPYDCNVF